ncbi:MAG: pre-peptidase, partial [Planctomycetia bacterium]|nr:pre-peptidase [Planctomycetia bacterium]
MWKPTRRAIVLALAMAAAGGPSGAYAQPKAKKGPTLPRPIVQSVFPSGVAAGGTVDVTVRGTDLEGARSLWFDHPGIRAFHLKGTTFRVACASGTPVGHHDVRAVGTYGLSNPRTFVVGDRAEANEVEPNNTPAQATAVAVNSVVNGFGRNLGGEPAEGLSADGLPLERKTVTLTTPPASGPDPVYPTRGYVAAPGAARRGFEYALASPSGSSNPVFIAEAVDPVVVEREPNDEPGKAQTVGVPCDISGCFGSPGDLDVYRFQAKKGEVYWVVANAERIGSQADPVFVVQKVNGKGETLDLATGDDTADRGDPVRFTTLTVDASVRWVAPEDGLYQVAISDLYGSQRGDVRLSYRLNIRPERPDFHLFLLPDEPNQPDGVTVPAGGRALASVLALRSDGFDGAIRVEAVDLPPGVRCEPTVIAAGLSTAPVVFEADETAGPSVGTVRLIGRARFGDRKEDVGYVPGVNTLGPDVSRQAVGGGII